MSGFVLRPRAQRDIEEIWIYSASKWGVNQAEIYLRQIQRVFELLAREPRLGHACDDVRLGYRKHPVGAHVVFYRLLEDGIDVVRILHGRMDVDDHL